MDKSLASLLLAVFTESYIVYQILIYCPFYISNETHALDATINLFVALTLSSYALGLILGHRLRRYLHDTHNLKMCLMTNFAFNIIGLIIMGDSTVFDRSIYHFIAGNFVMGAMGNAWSNVLSIAHLLHYDDSDLYYYLSAVHGGGTMTAGLIGAFLNINNGAKIYFMDTPFIIAIALCLFSLLCIYGMLDADACTVPLQPHGVNVVASSLDTDDDDECFAKSSSAYESLLASHRSPAQAPASVSATSQQPPPQPEVRQNVFYWYFCDTYGDAKLLMSLYDCICVFYSNRLFLFLWLFCVLLFSCLFSFDVLFPLYSSIAAQSGGMGWNSHYVGLFYIFYSLSWMVLILYRFYKLYNGFSVTTSFSHSSVKTLKFNSLTLALVYGVIFPFCINSASINHAEWKPTSWLLLGGLLALVLGIIAASSSYHIVQVFYDLILNEINCRNQTQSSSSQSATESAIHAKIQSVFIVLSNTFAYCRVILPLLVQFIFVISVHLNHAVIAKHLHSKREWYQIGNAVFYFLAALAVTAFLLLVLYDSRRREMYGEQIDRQEMNRLIRELRQQQQQLLATDEAMSPKPIQEDYHGLGFWMSLNSKAMLTASVAHPLCCKLST